MSAQPGSLKILLVDDSELFRSILKQYLQPIAREFLDANDGEEALALLELRPVDVVLADLQMPGIGGLELVRRIREDARREVRTIITVLITAERQASLLEEARRVGADELVLKPVRPAALRETLTRLSRQVN